MPLQYGDLIDHIGRVFGSSGRGWDTLQDIEWEADDLLKGAGKPSSDRFNLPLRDLPRKPDWGKGREDILEARTKLFDFDALFGHLEKSPVFQSRKDPTLAQAGYGSFVLPREAFVGQSVEDIRARLAFVSQTIQTDRIGDGSTAYRISGSTPRTAFLDDTAKQVFDMADVRSATRLVFDVETAGLETDKGIWQLSARLMRGDGAVMNPDGTEKSVNLLFRNNMMDLGAYGIDDAGRVTNFEDFYQALRGGGQTLDWIDSQDFAPRMMEFLQMGQEADYLVGQNTAFDVRQLLHGMEGQIKSSPAFEEAVTGFRQQIDQGKVVDTRMLSMMIFGEGNVLDIAPELQRIDKFTPQSMENILLQSSFLEDLAGDLNKQGLDGWEEITSRIKTGMHHGDIDTWFEDHLFRMQADVLSGTRSNILTSASLADAELRKTIANAAAITPFTRLTDLDGKGVDYTPIEMLVHHQRQWGSEAVEAASDRHLREGGIFRNWADNITTKEGRIGRAVALTDSGFETVQARAVKQGLPFGGISAMERLVSTAIGQHSVPSAAAGVNEVRRLMGDVTGSAIVQTAQKAGVHGGKNVALPMELIQAAEQSYLVGEPYVPGQRVLNSNFTAAMSDEVGALQTARWSAFTWEDGQKDLALVADIITGQEDVDRLTQFMHGLGDEGLKKYGLTLDKVDEISTALGQYGEKYGVQVGILGGKDNRSVANVARLMEQLGFDVDSKTAHMRTAVFGVGESGEGLMTTASMLDIDDFFTQHGERILEETRLTRDLVTKMMSRDLDPSIKRAVGAPSSNNLYSFLDRNLSNIKGRHFGYAGLGLASYYLFNKHKEQAVYDETTATQEYEDPMFYERYRQEMGEPVPENYRIRPSRESIDTAGMVQNLDRNSTRHHQMGPNKHSHLF